jgi:hypothetical protein
MIVYFDTICKNQEEHLQIRAVRNQIVDNLRNVAVKAYEYYNPGKYQTCLLIHFLILTF